MLFLACTKHTLTMSPELMKLRIKTKVLIKFGASEMMCRFESRKDMKCVQFDVKYSYVKCFLTCIEHTSTMSPELNEAQDYDY